MRYVTADAGCNVYVSSLPLHFTDQQLFDLFAPYGNITSARIMRAKDTRKSKGYGFVLFKDAASASRAIGALHGLPLFDSRLQVRLAHANASGALRKISKKQAALSEAMEHLQAPHSGQDTPLSDSFSQAPAVPQTTGLSLPAPSASALRMGGPVPPASFAPAASSTAPLLLDPATSLLLQGAGGDLLGASGTMQPAMNMNMLMVPSYMSSTTSNPSSSMLHMSGSSTSGLPAFPTSQPVLLVLPNGTTAIAYGL